MVWNDHDRSAFACSGTFAQAQDVTDPTASDPFALPEAAPAPDVEYATEGLGEAAQKSRRVTDRVPNEPNRLARTVWQSRRTEMHP